MSARWLSVFLSICLCSLCLGQTNVSHAKNLTRNSANTKSAPKNSDPSGAPAPTPQKHIVLLTGDFGDLKADTPLQASVVASDTTIIAEPKDTPAVLLAPGQLKVTYTLVPGQPAPAFVYIFTGKTTLRIPFTPVNADNELQKRRLTVSGDFCRATSSSHCATGLFSDQQIPHSDPGQKVGTSSSGERIAKSDIEGYVYEGDGANYTPVLVHGLQPGLADIEFSAQSTFHPAWLVLKHRSTAAEKETPATFPFTPALPEISSDVIYIATDLAKIFDQLPPNSQGSLPANSQGPAPANSQEVCDASTAELKSLSPSIASRIDLLSRHGDILFTRVTGRAGEAPPIISITCPVAPKTENQGAPKSAEPSQPPSIRTESKNAGDKSGSKGVNRDTRVFIARRTNRPASEQSLIDVTMTPMDQETVHKNFGAMIAQHYFAIQLDAVNRTSNKLQFNKSAIWFDVDLKESAAQYKQKTRQTASVLSADLIPLNPYYSNFTTQESCSDYVADQKRGTPRSCSVFRYGLEQTARISPINFSTVLNSFDNQTERVDRTLRYIEVFGAVLNTIATGSVVGQIHNTAFRDSAHILTGTFLPGFRSITEDLPGTDRLRANLVHDTFQEVVQIPANFHATTTVLLPRDAILTVKGYEQYVVIDRVLDVHIDPDVLNGPKGPPVPRGHIEVGFTKDQVRESLGEPTSVTAADDGTSTFQYKIGPYASVPFSVEQRVLTLSAERTLAEQLAVAPDLAAAEALLVGKTPQYLTLRNGNTIIVDIESVSTVPQFAANGKRLAAYTLLYPEIEGTKGKSRADLEKLLGQEQLPMPIEKAAPNHEPADKDLTASYDMPDIKGGTILVTFKTAAVNPDAIIDRITFQGTKSRSLDSH